MLFAPAPRVAAVLDESPDLTDSLGGWTNIEEEGSAGDWRLVDGGTAIAPLSDMPIPSGNPSGSFYLKDQTGPSSGVLYYEFILPESGPIQIYFEYFTQSSPELVNGTTMSLSEYPNQQFRVDIVTDILDPFGAPAVLANLYDGDSNVTAWTVFSTDLALVAAVDAYRDGVGTQTAYLAFREVDNSGHFQVGIDDVRITDASATFTLCDDNDLTAAEEFACSITNDRTTIVGAEEILAPAGPSITRDFGTDSVLHTQSETTAGFGMVRYVPSEDDRAGTEEIPPIPSYSNTYCQQARIHVFHRLRKLLWRRSNMTNTYFSKAMKRQQDSTTSTLPCQLQYWEMYKSFSTISCSRNRTHRSLSKLTSATRQKVISNSSLS